MTDRSNADPASGFEAEEPDRPGSDAQAAAPSQADGTPGTSPLDMRVGTTEREAAIEALGEHLATGRIDVDEYGERSARATVAKTSAELAVLFDDLPAPHPPLPGRAMTPLSALPVPGGTAPPPTPRTRDELADTRTAAQKLMAAAAAASVFVALGLFFLTGLWYWFLLIPAISAVATSLWGKDWKEPPADPGRRRHLGDGH